MKKLIKISAKPKLKSPIMLAAWPGVGNVAMLVANYLLDKFDFKDLAEIDANQFFDPIGVLSREHMIETPQFPQSHFYYWKNKKGEHDIILFIGDDQPDFKIYDFAGMCSGFCTVLWSGASLYLCRRNDQYSLYGTTQGLGSRHE